MKVAIGASLLRPISSNIPGGTEAFTHALTEGLVQKGVDVTLYGTSDSQTGATLRSVCSSIQTNGIFEGSVASNVLFEVFQARKIIEQSSEFDIIHNNYWSFYTLSSFSSFTNRPLITTVHNNFWHYPNIKEVLTNTHKKGKDVVVFISKVAQSQASDEIESVVINNGIDISEFSYAPSSDDYVLWFSRMDPNKGIKPAIDAAHQGNFKLVVAGTPPLKPDNIAYIEEHVKPFFAGNISYDGVPDKKQKVTLYQNAKAFLFPTLMEEQFGLVLVEAMSCGTPAIAYNRGAVSEVVKDGVTGFIIDPDDTPRPGKGTWTIKKQGVEGLSEAVARIGEIDRAACRAHVEENFTVDKMVSNYISLYERLASR